MSDPKVPHFLRVVRALANVRGAAIPIAAATTVVAGVAGIACSSTGITYMSGNGGAGGGGPQGVTVMPTGTGGEGPMGVTVMDAGSDSSSSSVSSSGFSVMDGGDGG